MVKGEWEPIISEALWYKAQECRNNRKVTIINTDGSKLHCYLSKWIRRWENFDKK